MAMLEMDRLIRQRDYLLDISRALTSQLSLNEVLRRILHSATEILGGQAGLIALTDGEDTFTLRASVGIKPALLHLFKPLLTDIPRQDPESFKVPELDAKMRLVAQAAGMGLHQVVALPMGIGREMVGLLYIFREKGGRFTRSDLRLLQSFAYQAAIAVHNARLYEQVTNEKKRLDAILAHSVDGIMIMSGDLRIESVNLALVRMTGWSAEDAAEAHHDDLVQWVTRQPGQDLNEAIANGWPFNESSTLYVEGDLRQQGGGTTSVGITYAALFDTHGTLRNIIADVWDITKFREAEEAKATFVSVISHELKTPVSLIKGYASTLLREDASWDEETLRNGLIVIEEEADRLGELIENLLDVTRLQAGKLSLNMGSVELDALAIRTAEKFRTQSDKHEIKTEFPPDFPLVRGDERRLGQVFGNLLSNAIKYSPNGGTILIQGRVTEGEVHVAVCDQGIGLTAAQQENIFERFYRVDNALSRETQGVGLGLYIVRSIIEAHGGRIWVESKPNKGTTFVIAIPLSGE